jgi:HPt (histidine-containing phosphotransfer) domain-containing protein
VEVLSGFVPKWEVQSGLSLRSSSDDLAKRKLVGDVLHSVPELCDSDLVKLVLETFLTDMPLQIGELQLRLESGDIPASIRHAHTIKGAASNVGGERLGKVAADMEHAARAGALTAVIDRMDDLRGSFAEFQEAIKQKWRAEQVG